MVDRAWEGVFLTQDCQTGTALSAGDSSNGVKKHTYHFTQ